MGANPCFRLPRGQALFSSKEETNVNLKTIRYGEVMVVISPLHVGLLVMLWITKV